MPIVINSLARTVFRERANATYIVVGNNTVSNVTSNASEIVVAGTITRVLWSTDAQIAVSRGANTLLTLRGQGHWDLKEMSLVLTEDKTANVVINTGTTANAVIILEITKDH